MGTVAESAIREQVNKLRTRRDTAKRLLDWCLADVNISLDEFEELLKAYNSYFSLARQYNDECAMLSYIIEDNKKEK